MIWMGTDGTSPDLKPATSVEVEITGIGILRNPFVAASAKADASSRWLTVRARFP